MAIIFSSALQHLKGKIGNFIFYHAKGQLRMRSYGKPNTICWTSEQKLQQNRLRAVVFFYRVNQTTLLPKIWKIAARDMVMSGYNLFIRENMSVFNAEHSIGDYSMLHVSQGRLEFPQTLQVSSYGRGEIRLMWANLLPKTSSNMSHRLHVVWLDGKGDFSLHVLSVADVSRRDEEAVLPLPEAGSKDLHLFVYFSNKEETQFSPDRYLFLPAIE